MKQTIVETQLYLRERGFDPGPIDGKWGPKTSQAYNLHLKKAEYNHIVTAKQLGLPKDKTSELVAYYGNLDSIEDQLVSVAFPWKAYFSGKLVKSIRIHKKAADSLRAALKELWELAGHDQLVIDKWGLSTYDGSYANRPVRGGSSPSTHAFGAAIDFDASDNPNNKVTGDREDATIPEIVLDVFSKHGWASGGRKWGRDYMHCQRTQ